MTNETFLLSYTEAKLQNDRAQGIIFMEITTNFIKDMPWGTHACHFYQTKKDLIDTLIPYFRIGLENNEFCMWITSNPLNVKEANEAMKKAMPDFDEYLNRGQIEIIPYTKWYFKGGIFDHQRVLNVWVDKLNKALDKGYEGMRVSGNTSWLGEKYWRKFIAYEEEINNVIGKYRMKAICTYSRNKCGISEFIDVINNHKSVISNLPKSKIIEWIKKAEASEPKRRGSEFFKEKRKHKRSLFFKPIRFYLTSLQTYKLETIHNNGFSVDISEGGLGMTTRFPLARGDILYFEDEIKLYDHVAKSATVRWASQMKKNKYRVGLEFVR